MVSCSLHEIEWSNFERLDLLSSHAVLHPVLHESNCLVVNLFELRYNLLRNLTEFAAVLDAGLGPLVVCP